MKYVVIAVVMLAWAAAPRAQDRPMAWNVEPTVAAWREVMAQGGVGSYAILGDSISFRNDSCNWFLRDLLEERFGNAGDGYLSLSGSFGHTPDGSNNRRPGLAIRRFNGTWVVWPSANGTRDTRGRLAVDGIYTHLGGPGWVEMDFFGPSAALHYVREVGAGIIRLTLNGVVIAELDASLKPGAAPELAVYSFETGVKEPGALSTLRCSLVGATTGDPQWTQLNGLHMTTGLPGAMYHRFGRGGVGPEDFLLCEPHVFRETLEAVAPGLVIVMIDQTGALPPYQQDMGVLLDRIEAALPGTPIVLMSHHAFNPQRGPAATILYELAQARGHGFINLFDLHHDANHLASLGFLIDSVHFSPAGGRWYGEFIDAVLMGWRIPSEESLTFGTHVSGGLYEARAVDEQFHRARSRFGFTALEPNLIEWHAELVLDADEGEFLDIRFAASSDTPNTRAKVRLLREATQTYAQIAEVVLGSSVIDAVVPVEDAAEFIDAEGRVRVSVRSSVLATFTALGFTQRVDLLAARRR